jgi:hypothetical protein
MYPILLTFAANVGDYPGDDYWYSRSKVAVPQINLEEIVQLDETHYIEDVLVLRF